jgi:hypothetical protein
MVSSGARAGPSGWRLPARSSSPATSRPEASPPPRPSCAPMSGRSAEPPSGLVRCGATPVPSAARGRCAATSWEHRPGWAGWRSACRSPAAPSSSWVASPGAPALATPLPPSSATPESGQSPATRQMSLTDAVLSTRWRVANVDMDMALGRRFARNAPGSRSGVSASQASPPTSPGGGREGRSDPVTAVPGSKYLVMGSGSGSGPRFPRAKDRCPRPPTTPRSGSARRYPPVGNIVRAPGASQVELAGTSPTGARWPPAIGRPQLARRASHPSGLHRLAVRFDRGAWRAPQTRPIRNEFGGEVTEIVVE